MQNDLRIVRSHGFTLIEITVVITILALLIGGIVFGRNMVRGANVRSVLIDMQTALVGVRSFRDKYGYLPGDFPDATLVWGKDNTNCAGHSGTAATPGTCNGDGNGKFGLSFGPSTEHYRVWDHLARAGFWQGSWPGIASIAPGQSVAGDNPGINIPVSAYQFKGYRTLAYKLLHVQGSAGDLYNLEDRGNYFFMAGGINACCGAPYIDSGSVTPPDSYMIDTKMDDGRPDLGKLQIKNSYWGGCATSSTSPAAYRLTRDDSTGACPLLYNMGLESQQ